jgi:hypothetical protein
MIRPLSWLALLRRKRRRALRVKFAEAHAENVRLWREAAREVDPFWIDWIQVEPPVEPRATTGAHSPKSR